VGRLRPRMVALLLLVAATACKAGGGGHSTGPIQGGPRDRPPTEIWILPAKEGMRFTDGNALLDV
jgi:hypothetical protein